MDLVRVSTAACCHSSL
ncbi:hypothetical protein [Rhodococcus pyridinivorans]